MTRLFIDSSFSSQKMISLGRYACRWSFRRLNFQNWNLLGFSGRCRSGFWIPAGCPAGWNIARFWNPAGSANVADSAYCVYLTLT